ncbi:MAG: hypothetical protein AB2L11_05535 [Syntrophobacteraceae bacterium]
MASKTQKTEAIRARKHAPNRINMKQEQKRLRENLRVLEKVAEVK